MLIPFFIVIIFIMDGVVKRKAVDIAVNTCGYDFSVIMGDSYVLDVVGKGKKLSNYIITFKVS